MPRRVDGLRQDAVSRGRIYIGYTGWTGAQLRQEWMRGLWRVMPGSAGAVFDPEPERLWERLQGRQA